MRAWVAEVAAIQCDVACPLLLVAYYNSFACAIEALECDLRPRAARLDGRRLWDRFCGQDQHSGMMLIPYLCIAVPWGWAVRAGFKPSSVQGPLQETTARGAQLW